MLNYRASISFAIGLLLMPALAFANEPPRQLSAGELQLAIDRLGVVGSVLYVAAHPDDENTRLISYLANGKLLRVGYLSLTRGDGGQNLIGVERGELFGVIRTQELLGARRIDGAEQFFTRAIDFGYSKTSEETLKIWGEQEILSDVVLAIRTFRPDVIITRFRATGEGGHGHHTASAILAEKAFALAADANAFAEQLDFVAPWQAKRLVWNKFNWRRDPKDDLSHLPNLEVGGYNPLLGLSYGELAGSSRSMHKSQGFGAPRVRGHRLEHFVPLLGAEPKGDIFGGIELTWKRFARTDELRRQIAVAQERFSSREPHEIVPTLLEIRAALAKVNDPTWRKVKLAEVERAIVQSTGLFAEATSKEHFGVPGKTMHLTVSVINRSPLPARLLAIRWPDGRRTTPDEPLANDNAVQQEREFGIPASTPYSHPHWLNQAAGAGRYTVKEQGLRVMPIVPPPLAVELAVEVAGLQLTLHRSVTYKWVDPVQGERYRPFAVSPAAVTLASQPAILFPDSKARSLRLSVKAMTSELQGVLHLEVPKGWQVRPASRKILIHTAGDELSVEAEVQPPTLWDGKAATLGAVVVVGKAKLDRSLVRIEYQHIPTQSLFPQSTVKLVPLDLKRHGSRIGYIMGAGDEVPESLQQVGYQVSLLSDEELARSDLNGYDAIVVGVRAYNTRERMRFHSERLFHYVARGGTVVAQYSTNTRWRKLDYAVGPHPMEIARGRVTDENAEMRLLLPEHPVLTFPNRISASDFSGWVQERGLYFAETWDERYQAIFACHDPGEQPLKGSLLVAKHGKGTFIYTGLSFFRQLPAGVPGAYRLFANLLAQ